MITDICLFPGVWFDCPRLLKYLVAQQSRKNIVLADVDEARTWTRKMERAAALIYTHFKKEFGAPQKRNERI
jgi:hypothetical protein